MTSLSTTVLITGASSGIGREFAHIFAKKGYNLILVARRRDLLEDIKTEYKNIHIEIIEKDLSVSGSVGELYEAVQAKNLQVDILINNAGFGDFGYFHEGDIQKYREMIQLNITALTELCYMFGKEMISRNNGKILNVASTAAFQPGPLMSVYFATKHYVLAFSEGIAEEWSQYGVVVTALCPGPTESGFQVGARATQNKMFTKKLPSSSEVAEYGYSALILTSALLVSQSAFASFPDTELSYYRDSIEILASEGIISGYDDGRFGPDNTITRAEMLKVLFGTKGVSPVRATKRCFGDVGITKWYHPYICEGVALGMVRGFDDGSFHPDAPVTILEALAMGLRMYGLAPANGNPWYIPYQELANTNHILDSASYSVSSPMTRGKASELILRVREYSSKKSPLQSLSKGCSIPQTLRSGTYEVTVAGKTRSYILTVPSSYSRANPAGLIIAIHGRTNSNSMVQNYMGLEGSRRGGSQSDYIVAYPAGLPSGSAFSWSSEENITFVDTIIRDVTDSLCVSRSDIDIVAHSLGAWFASRLACTQGDVFRSLAIVGGGGYTSSCNDTPTATLIYQNPNDTLSSPAIARATESKMKLVNKCGATTVSVQIGGFSCQKWADCSTGNPVVWCENYPTYGNDTHSWPKSGGSSIVGWIRGL